MISESSAVPVDKELLGGFGLPTFLLVGELHPKYVLLMC